jgi:hypothetical protein
MNDTSGIPRIFDSGVPPCPRLPGRKRIVVLVMTQLVLNRTCEQRLFAPPVSRKGAKLPLIETQSNAEGADVRLDSPAGAENAASGIPRVVNCPTSEFGI